MARTVEGAGAPGEAQFVVALGIEAVLTSAQARRSAQRRCAARRSGLRALSPRAVQPAFAPPAGASSPIAPVNDVTPFEFERS